MFENKCDKPHEKQKFSAWNFEQPVLDHRSSCFVNAGNKFGVGHKNPVGHLGNAKHKVSTMPMECKMMDPYEKSSYPN